MKKLAAILMSLLILSIPFVSALQLESFTAAGQDKIPQIIRQNDSIFFNITMYEPDASLLIPSYPQYIVNSSTLKIVGTQDFPVTACAYVNGTNASKRIYCTRTLAINTSAGGVFNYQVDFAGDIRPGQLYLDTSAPSYSEMSLDVTQNGSVMLYTLSATDIIDANNGLCSGLASYALTIPRNSTSSTAASGTFNGSSCSQTINGNFSLSGVADGALQVCANVKDKFSNNMTKCASTTIDVVKPVVSNLTLRLSDGSLLSYIPPNGADIYATFNVFEANDLDMSKTTLQAKRIVQNAIKDESISLDCNTYTQELTGKNYLCQSAPFDVESGSVSFGIIATDVSGNFANATANVTLLVDSTGPVVSSISGGVLYNNTLYFGANGNFTVTFTETGLGMDSNQAYVSFDYSQQVRSQSCNGTSGSWACVFLIPSLAEGQHVLSIDGATADDGGNLINLTDANSSTQFYIDLTAPSISIGNVTGVTQLGSFDFTSAGGKVIVNYTVTEATPFESSVNFSKLGKPDTTVIDDSYNIVTATCDGSDCIAYSDPVGPGGYSDYFLITATDLVGNNASASYLMKVLSVNDGTKTWSGSFVMSPTAWDREVAELIAQKGYAEITLTSTTQTTLVSADFQDCISGENLTSTQGGKEYLGNIQYISGSADLFNHYVQLESKQAGVYIDSANIICRFAVSSYGENELVPSEVVNVPMSIGYYNNPYDLPDEALQGKIEDAIDETKGMLKTLDSIYEWVKWLERICGVWNFINGVIVSIGTILYMLFGIEFGVEKIVPVGPVAAEVPAATQQALCKSGDVTSKLNDVGYLSFIGNFCAWVSCDASLWNLFDSDYWSSDKSIPDSEKGFNANTWVNNAAQKVSGGSSGNVLAADNIDVFSQDNIITQVLNLCIPGMLKKAHEYRAIKCSYALCLIEQVGNGIVDEAACETVRNSLECKFWFGEIWSLVPFSGLIEQLFKMWEVFKLEHWSDLLQIGTWACAALCASPKYAGKVYNTCKYVANVQKFAESVATLLLIGDNFEKYFNFDDNANACKNMEDAYDKLKESNKAFDDKVRTRLTPSNSTASGSTAGTLPAGYGGTAATTGTTTGSTDTATGTTTDSTGTTTDTTTTATDPNYGGVADTTGTTT